MNHAEVLDNARNVLAYQKYKISGDHETNVEAALEFMRLELIIDGRKVTDHDIYVKCGISDTCGKK